MAEYLIQSETLDDIADAINAKTGGSSAMTPAEMVTEIESIQTGITPTGTKQISITGNGTTTEDVADYANAEITVSVPMPSDSIEKTEWTAASDVNSTTQSFYYGQSYVDRSFVGVQIIDITNNSATSNKAERVVIDTRSERPGRMDVFFRGGAVTIVSSGQSFNWTAGTVFTRFKIPSSMFPA